MTNAAMLKRTEHTASLYSLMHRLWCHMSGKRRRQYVSIVMLMALAAFAELLSIGAVLPYLAALTQPKVIFSSAFAAPVINFFKITSDSELITVLTIIFVLVITFSCLVRMGVLWSSTRFSFAFGSDIGIQVYRSTLYQPYDVHTSRNSSEVINAIWGKVCEVVFYILIPSMSMFTSFILAITVCLAFVFTVPGPALMAVGVLVVVYAVIVKLSRHRLKLNSKRIAQGSTDVIKTLQEGLGGIRDIIIDGSQENFLASYQRVSQDLRNAQKDNLIIGMGPRYILEALGMLLIAILAYVLTMQPNGVMTAIPLLAAIALGLQRLMPAAQLMFSTWSTIHGAQTSLKDVLDMLDLPSDADIRMQEMPPIPFVRDIKFRGVSFRHSSNGAWIFEPFDLTIAKGARVGFVGLTGGGKSTLLDITMGLLMPSTGRIEIDGVPIDTENRGAWQKRIAHVPQNVFLADCSLEENIAFGIPKEKIDHERVKRAAKQAQLAALIEDWPSGYATRVGERGVQLSGGQRQRIGIARALYKDVDVIAFDEATSALDNETEHSVMSAIESLSGSITVLIIAHRLNTLKGCTEIYEVGHGTVKKREAFLGDVGGLPK